MSDKNRDVDSAIASVGGKGWVYHSFKPLILVAGKTAAKSLFAYNEFGEPQYAADLQLPLPSPSSSPDDEYLEDAAYPEMHPDETWYDIPAPESHTAVFIAPAAAFPAVAETAPVAGLPVTPPFAPIALRQPSPPVFAARQTPAGEGVFVPFLPSALPQASVQASAHLYSSAERATERPLERALERAFERPVEPPLLQKSVEPVVLAPAIVSSPVAPSFVERPISTLRPVPSLPIGPPTVPPAYKPASPPRAATASAGPAEGAPYPQPFETLAETYARLARLPKENAATPRLRPQGDTEEQRMFRRL